MIIGDAVVGVTRSSDASSLVSFDCTCAAHATPVGSAVFVPFDEVVGMKRSELSDTDTVAITLDWQSEESIAAFFVVMTRDWLGAFSDRCASLGVSVLSGDLRGTHPITEGVIAAERAVVLEDRAMRVESRPGRGAVGRWLPELARGDGYTVSEVLQYASSGAGQAGIGVDGFVFRELRKNAPRLRRISFGFGSSGESIVAAWRAGAAARSVPRTQD